jgi:hypothetical protein
MSLRSDKTVISGIDDSVATVGPADYLDLPDELDTIPDFATWVDLEYDLREAAQTFEFEKAVKLRNGSKPSVPRSS